jgi:predicted O-methyltransferase YrrM
LRYLGYLLTSKSKHGVHSPFVFDFTTQILNKANRDIHKYHKFEHLRYRMLRSKSVVEMEDFGAKGPRKYSIRLSKLVRNASKMAKYSRLLHVICQRFQPTYCIELGTNVGISALYQASALSEGYLFTLEGSTACVEIANYNIERAGLQNIQVVPGEFDVMLPKVLEKLPRIDFVFFDGNHSMDATLKYFEMCKKKAHNNTIFIFDDINWSMEMQECWEIIKRDKDVQVTIDLFVMGIVFFRKEQEKEHFKIRY